MEFFVNNSQEYIHQDIKELEENQRAQFMEYIKKIMNKAEISKVKMGISRRKLKNKRLNSFLFKSKDLNEEK